MNQCVYDATAISSCQMGPWIFFLVGLGILFFILSMIISVVIWCMLFHKAGFGWFWGLLLLVPIVNVILPFYLAFSDWPVRRELRYMKKMQKEKGKLNKQMKEKEPKEDENE